MTKRIVLSSAPSTIFAWAVNGTSTAALVACVITTTLVTGCSPTGGGGPAGQSGAPLPSGESWTYANESSGSTFTLITESVDGFINGYEVVRFAVRGDPPDLGLYSTYDPDRGIVDVATDAWIISNPADHSLEVWDPPLFRCRFGDEPGTQCDWRGTLNGQSNRELTEVDGYVPITVPYGTFANTMRMRVTSFDQRGEVIIDMWYWIDRDIGIVATEDIDDGSRLVLKSYSPPPGGVGIFSLGSN